MFFKSIGAATLLAAKAAATIYYAGVAESGGEFGVYSSTATVGTGLPGRFGVDYDFINEAAIDTYVDQNKVNLFRVAFLLERMCPLATGLGSTFNETYYQEFADAVNYITVTKGAYCILDPHNYMRYNNPSQQPTTGSIIGDTTDAKAATTAQFATFWATLAGRFKSNEKVIFGLMNEPHDMDTNLILTNDQAAITAIRGVGANQLIIAPGNGYTGGHSWTQEYTGNSPASSTVMYKITDPINNTAFDIHEYLDSDFSGTHANCSQAAATNLAPLTSWLQQYGFKAMITEFGGANGTECDSYITDMVNYMAENDVYIGWTAWAAGPFWGTNSACCSDSMQWGSLEPGSTAADGSPGMYTTVWLKEIQPLLPTTLVKSGISSLNPNGTTGGSSSSSSKVSASTSVVASSTMSTKVSTTSTAAAGVPLYGQCGGTGWAGATVCAVGTCKYSNAWYSQCLN
ncbi:cellulase-domain-containing protein [Mollisia scopiformis]|uniref:cellulase n=1 Tax=Mollisia scopiformis TaxID=149040 RepID=A0A194WZ13_MOLSC|nr:cellulase-domain-containing protein [Mollisia scopiformis]KUJ12934.1 cellulase-domain-containing protein [Mollisia scopiformis]